jgi:hypothetical protein
MPKGWGVLSTSTNDHIWCTDSRCMVTVEACSLIPAMFVKTPRQSGSRCVRVRCRSRWSRPLSPDCFRPTLPASPHGSTPGRLGVHLSARTSSSASLAARILLLIIVAPSLSRQARQPMLAAHGWYGRIDRPGYLARNSSQTRCQELGTLSPRSICVVGEDGRITPRVSAAFFTRHPLRVTNHALGVTRVRLRHIFQRLARWG